MDIMKNSNNKINEFYDTNHDQNLENSKDINFNNIQKFGSSNFYKEDTSENRKILTVGQVTLKIKDAIENRQFQDIWVKGELSNKNFSSTGHLFFSLKEDSDYLLKAVMWKSNYSKLKISFEDGDTLLCHGYISLYAKAGEYKLICDKIEKEGKGDFWKRFEQMKAKLSKEGLFEETNKKPIPAFPKKIGVVTAPTGAAIRDIINVITRRAPYVDILIFPAAVQGEEASSQIAQAIRIANEISEIDVLIVARGGGSIEDLWPFNEEEVARAIFESKIPVISGVGHEVDFTIADFVADRRAPTPSAAAEIAVKNTNEVKSTLTNYQNRLNSLLETRTNNLKEKLKTENILNRLSKHIFTLIDTKRFIVNDHVSNLENKIERKIDTINFKLNKATHLLKALSPNNILKRGFTIISKDSKIIARKSQLSENDNIKITFYDGDLKATINKN